MIPKRVRTNAWAKQIANSNLKYPPPVSISKGLIIGLDKIITLVETPAIAIITWPALIFAASRNDKVKGRIKELTPSTKDRNGAILFIVPSGR